MPTQFFTLMCHIVFIITCTSEWSVIMIVVCDDRNVRCMYAELMKLLYKNGAQVQGVQSACIFEEIISCTTYFMENMNNNSNNRLIPDR